MLTDITIGQYFPGSSMLHQLDARTKVISLLGVITVLLSVQAPAAYAAFCSFAAVLMCLSKVPVKLYVKAVKPLWWVLAFTFLIHLFATPGERLFQIGFLSATREGLGMAVAICLRLALLICFSSVLTFTTSPITLTDALERLLQPFKRIGLPAHELAMMMTIALRFIPTLLEETERIMKAQEARGADFSSGGILRRVRNMIPLLVPLFVSAFRRADDLAVAMEARCYRGGQQRTRLHVLRFGRMDYVAWVALASVLTGMLWLQRYGGGPYGS